MIVFIEKRAAKYVDRLNEPIKSRIRKAVMGLANEPLSGDIKKLRGQEGYRCRVGEYRILFDVMEDEVTVYKITPRGEAYKE
jgi:mRNA interferase RelE/StbE